MVSCTMSQPRDRQFKVRLNNLSGPRSFRSVWTSSWNAGKFHRIKYGPDWLEHGPETHEDLFLTLHLSLDQKYLSTKFTPARRDLAEDGFGPQL